MRGFESTVDHRLHFGLGQTEKIDSIVVNWNNQTRSTLTEVAANQILKIETKNVSWQNCYYCRDINYHSNNVSL